MRACVECSVKNSRVANPCQQFFEENIFQTELFRSDKYLHILVRVDGHIADSDVNQLSMLEQPKETFNARAATMDLE